MNSKNKVEFKGEGNVILLVDPLNYHVYDVNPNNQIPIWQKNVILNLLILVKISGFGDGRTLKRWGYVNSLVRWKGGCRWPRGI